MDEIEKAFDDADCTMGRRLQLSWSCVGCLTQAFRSTIPPFQGKVSNPSLLLLDVIASLGNEGSSNRIVVLFGGVSVPERASIVGAGVIPFEPSGTAGGKRDTFDPTRLEFVPLWVSVRVRAC